MHGRVFLQTVYVEPENIVLPDLTCAACEIPPLMHELIVHVCRKGKRGTKRKKGDGGNICIDVRTLRGLGSVRSAMNLSVQIFDSSFVIIRVARGCDAVVKDGILTMTGSNDTPFLGCAASRTAGPAVVKLRARSAAGGEGKIEWLPSDVAARTEGTKSVPFTIKAGDWQEASVDAPAQGPLGILRVYLPAQKQPVELDWIELKANGTLRRWEFNGK